ncbi:hypothetical protein LZQ00_00680 [Sphingobacterium sp. SRCM116780]|uniref:hypothetical protein n=1 Tax=Sphingobacterium sp. SRCM116780 TaxID=2907623 RepID=UPI001F38CBB7|nr:hypothetical protein [Sphingobacterium sp. SRCM116780]UIR56357.1 hypothetical protein LZQ00_00680 [Sphingobacterium sp. SRCM116780]
MNIINKYEISFSNKILDFKTGNEIVKIVNVNNPILGEFLIGWFSAKEIDELLLPDVDDALSNPNAALENGSETVSIYIYYQTVKFHKDNIQGWAYELPTQDFKEIVLLWRDFLLTPPLNGTRV